MAEALVEDLPTVVDVIAAAERINGRVRRTPVLSGSDLDAELGCALYFKCDNLQIGGAFKLRGAMNAVWSLSDAEAARGVATHSSGNHGAALARAARARGIPCHVVVPEGTVATKLRNMSEQGAILHFCAPTQAAREATLAQVLTETGAVSVPPYDDARVIAGQGTAALELLEEVPDLDVLIAPVGGGGLLSGTALVARAHAGARGGAIKIIGAEPLGANDTALSFAAGHRVSVATPNTIADGLRATIGIRNFAIIHRDVDAIWTADEPSIISTTRLLWERLKMLIEPSSAVAVAALIANAEPLRGRRVGVIVSGGNVDLDALPFQSS